MRRPTTKRDEEQFPPEPFANHETIQYFYHVKLSAERDMFDSIRACPSIDDKHAFDVASTVAVPQLNNNIQRTAHIFDHIVPCHARSGLQH
jgi:hypothetical protein